MCSQKVLLTGFKGKNNSSSILVQSISENYRLLTNSFEGLKKDIEEIDDNGNLSKKALIVKDRKVFDNTGKSLDFGDAYPLTTESGKMMITKKFISAWV